MRNLSKLVFQRVVAVSVGILLQIGFLIVMATYLRADFFWIRIAMNVLSWAMVIYIISCGVNPSYKIAWIVLILAFPVAGLTIYLLFGGNKISSYEHRKMQSIEAVTMQQLQQEEEPLWELAAARTPAFNHARYLLSASGYPIYDDADATYFPSGESCYAAMLEELQKAEHYIFIEFFIIAQGKMWDPILQLLREKAAAGVDVRVVYDDFGCITRLPMQYAKKLREMGIRAHAFNPYVPILSARLNNRDHRKLMIIDGKAAFTGGVNLADEYINELERFGRAVAAAGVLGVGPGVLFGFGHARKEHVKERGVRADAHFLGLFDHARQGLLAARDLLFAPAFVNLEALGELHHHGDVAHGFAHGLHHLRPGLSAAFGVAVKAPLFKDHGRRKDQVGDLRRPRPRSFRACGRP